jgi:hypothetical protein
MKIDPIHRAIADNYLGQGCTMMQAYLNIKPDVTPGSAKALASKLFKRDDVQAYITDKQDKITVDSIASRTYLIKEAHDIGKEAREAGKLNTALTAVETKGKLNRVYDTDADSPADYTKLIQALVIQGDVNIYNDKGNTETIDITPS